MHNSWQTEHRTAAAFIQGGPIKSKALPNDKKIVLIRIKARQ